MMPRVFLGLGSNIGDRFFSLCEALRRIRLLPGTSVVAVSHVFETEPYGVKDQPDFLNAAAEIRTDLDVHALHRELKSLESALGRKHAGRWGPREIDIDLLYYDSDRIATDVLVVPHPEISKRKFVLVPMAEIATNFKDPESGMSMSDLLAQCPDQSTVERYPKELLIEETSCSPETEK